MVFSTAETPLPYAVAISVSGDTLAADLADGRTIAVPLAWFPRLLHATEDERRNWQLIDAGRGIRWSDLDEDISIESLLSGKSSGESQLSLRRWLAERSGNRVK